MKITYHMLPVHIFGVEHTQQYYVIDMYTRNTFQENCTQYEASLIVMKLLQ